MKHMFRNCVLAALLLLAAVITMTPSVAMAATPTILNVDGSSILTAPNNTITCGEGTAEYDQASNTLTLTNITIEGTPSGSASIYTNGSLTIQLVGTNSISSEWHGIYGDNDDVEITIGGSGTLAIQAGNDCVRAGYIVIGIDGEASAPTLSLTGEGSLSDSGIYATKTLTIQNGATVDATGKKMGYALCGEGGVSIIDSEVHATADSPQLFNAIATWGDLVISGSTVTAQANSTAAIYSAQATSISDSVVTAQSTGYYTVYSVGGCTLNGTWLDNVDSESLLNNETTTDSVVIDYNSGTVIGNPVIKRDVELREDAELTIPEGTSLTIADGAVFNNNGTVVLGGSFVNDNAKVLCADGSHVGGTASCTSRATCSLCGEEYGDLDAHQLTKTEAKAATCTKPGNTEYWTCGVCDKAFSDSAGEHEITLDDAVVPATGHSWGEDGRCTVCGAIDPDFAPKIIAGANVTWQKGSDKGLTFTSNAAYGDFQKVQVDGRDVDASNYTVEEGSTIVTLKASYLETLSVGKHTLGIVSQTGTAETEFTIAAAAQETLASTGDASTPLATPLLVLASALVGAGALVLRRSRS